MDVKSSTLTSNFLDHTCSDRIVLKTGRSSCCPAVERLNRSHAQPLAGARAALPLLMRNHGSAAGPSPTLPRSCLLVVPAPPCLRTFRPAEYLPLSLSALCYRGPPFCACRHHLPLRLRSSCLALPHSADIFVLPPPLSPNCVFSFPRPHSRVRSSCLTHCGGRTDTARGHGGPRGLVGPHPCVA